MSYCCGHRLQIRAKLELIDTKKVQLNTAVHVYRDLGGGWK
jgi:hypothetical protein